MWKLIKRYAETKFIFVDATIANVHGHWPSHWLEDSLVRLYGNAKAVEVDKAEKEGHLRSSTPNLKMISNNSDLTIE